MSLLLNLYCLPVSVKGASIMETAFKISKKHTLSFLGQEKGLAE